MLHVQRFGTGSLLVFVHGWGISSAYDQFDFEPVFAGRDGWERLYFDLPGMGNSPADPTVHTLDDLLNVVLNTIDACTEGRPFALCGTSVGGYLARAIVAARPDKVHGLMLRCPVVHPTERNRPVFAPLLEDGAFMASLSESDRADVDKVLIQRPGFVAAYLKKLRGVILPAEQQSKTSFLEGIRNAPERYVLRQSTETVPFHGPTLMVTGRQDLDVGYQDAWPLLEHYPRATFAALDRTGHDWPLPEEPQQRLFAVLVNDWLDRLEEVSAPNQSL